MAEVSSELLVVVVLMSDTGEEMNGVDRLRFKAMLRIVLRQDGYSDIDSCVGQFLI